MSLHTVSGVCGTRLFEESNCEKKNCEKKIHNCSLQTTWCRIHSSQCAGTHFIQFKLLICFSWLSLRQGLYRSLAMLHILMSCMLAAKSADPFTHDAAFSNKRKFTFVGIHLSQAIRRDAAKRWTCWTQKSCATSCSMAQRRIARCVNGPTYRHYFQGKPLMGNEISW